MSHDVEAPTRIEPVLLDEDPSSVLKDLSLELIRESSGLPGRLPPATVGELADLVRIVNCHFSNLIEGHDTCPVDVETALAGLRTEPERPRISEALAHVAVQRHIDRVHAAGILGVPLTADVRPRWSSARREVRQG